ncbi:hypothetical protein [Anaerotignum faecicola]
MEPVSQWVPNLRNRGKGNKVSLSNPFPTMPETAGKKAVRLKKGEENGVSEWAPNLRRQRKGRIISLSNPFPTMPETAGRKAARCACEKPMIKSTYKKE